MSNVDKKNKSKVEDDEDDNENSQYSDADSDAESSDAEESVVDLDEEDEEVEDVDEVDDDIDEEDVVDDVDEKIASMNPAIEIAGKYDEGEDDEDDDEDETDELYLQKFNSELNKNYLIDTHPESVIHNQVEISALTTVIRDVNNNIIDDLHVTIPYLTKYEKTRILGQRAKQINTGAKVFVKVPDKVFDGYLIAEMELKEKRIPFIIRRPIPGGGCEYWNLKDLECIDF